MVVSMMVNAKGAAAHMEMVVRFLGSYSDSFLLAFGLWPFVSFAFTLPILAFLYRRDGRIRFTSAVAVYLSVLYVLGIACFTLYPLPTGESGLGITYGVSPQLDPLAFVGDLAREGISALPQILFNIAFFMPLGFIAARLLRLGPFASILLGFGVSLIVETAQLTGLFGIYAYAYRTFDVNDLMYNTFGTALGWVCAALLARVLPPRALADEEEVTTTPGFVRRCVALWLDMLVVGLATVVICTLVWLADDALSMLWDAVAALAPSFLGAEDTAAEGTSTWPVWVAATLFVIEEGVVPYCRGGQTLGGSFVRMTCETRERTGLRRVAFYLVRLAVVGLAVTNFWSVPFILVIFYAVKRKMPYDYI